MSISPIHREFFSTLAHIFGWQGYPAITWMTPTKSHHLLEKWVEITISIHVKIAWRFFGSRTIKEEDVLKISANGELLFWGPVVWDSWDTRK